MKKIMSFLVVFVAVFIMGATAFADINAKAFTFSPFIGGYVFESKENLDNKMLSGLRLGYEVNKNVGVEGVFEFFKTEYSIPALTSKTNYFGYRLEALYNFMPERRWVPYLAVGAGGRSLGYDHPQVNNRNQFALDYGVGLKYFLYSNLAIRADVRHIYVINDTANNFEYTLGATMYFGGSKQQAAVAPAVLDSDNDGVTDNYDNCPGTPMGVAVDQVGCPLDSDQDGVPDYLDKCPGTPAGVAVDRDGCPLDTDKDGVPDYLDKCPGTPAGVKVDKDGCPIPVKKEVRAEAPAAAPVVEQKEAPAAAPVVTKRQAAAAAVAKEMFEKGRATINVEFDFDKAVVKPAYNEEIQKFADVMKDHQDLKVVIEGHTDNVGKKAYNQKLSEKRANSVKNYMIEKFGIEKSRLTAKGYGMSKPIDSNKTKAGRQKNRRVEAVVDYMIKK